MTAPTYKNLRQALFDRLSGQLTASVWSPKAPQDADGNSLTPFPYVAIVQAAESPWNTAGSIGGEWVVQIDGYARATASTSVENAILNLHADVRQAIERVRLVVSDAHWVDTQFDGMTLGWDDDGHTRRFVSLYRIILDEA